MIIMLMKIKDGLIVASHIMATGIDLEIYSDIMRNNVMKMVIQKIMLLND